MLSASELRIGNLVWDSYSGEMIVEHIDRRTETIFLAKTIDLPTGLYNLDKIHPIPLTEEWLLKFGFEKICTSIPDNSFAWYKSIITFYYPEMMVRMANVFIEPKIKFVHQLQNLFYCLTGEELEPKKA